MSLKGKVVIITGSAKGLGKEYAIHFAKHGARVVVCDILDCKDTAEEIERSHGEVLSLRTDVSDEESSLDMAKKTVEHFGRIDILVNNAAIYADIKKKPFFQFSVEEWDKIMAVNLKGTFLCCKAVFPYMKEQAKGKIINISSNTVHAGIPFMIPYTVSKGGVIAFTRVLARELGDYNINVNAVAPGHTLTDAAIASPMPGMTEEDFIEQVVKRRSLKRRQYPSDLVGTILFLASDESEFITGQTVVVDGGSTMI